MNQKLDEIKKFAKHSLLYSDNTPIVQELATHCLRLIEALEKCREQRDEEILQSMREKGWKVINTPDYDSQLTKILEGKNE